MTTAECFINNLSYLYTYKNVLVESSLIIMWRFLGGFSLFAPSTTLKVNEQPSILPIVAPDAVSGVTAGLSKALGLVLLANAVNASISCRGAGVVLNVL